MQAPHMPPPGAPRPCNPQTTENTQAATQNPYSPTSHVKAPLQPPMQNPPQWRHPDTSPDRSSRNANQSALITQSPPAKQRPHFSEPPLQGPEQEPTPTTIAPRDTNPAQQKSPKLFNVQLSEHFFPHLGSHYLFSMRSQQDKGRKARQVRSVIRRCSHFHPLCIFVKGQVRFLYHNVTPSLAMKFRKNITIHVDFIL